LSDQVISDSLPSAPKQDVSLANKLLDEAKWTQKDGAREKNGKQLTLTITTVKSSQYDRVAQSIQQQLATVGIAVTIESIDRNAPGANYVQNVLQARNFDMLIGELPIGADPDVYPYWHSSQAGVSGYNFSGYANDIADAALTSARDRLEMNLRTAKYVTFAKQWYADVPAIGLFQQTMSYVARQGVVSLDASYDLVTTYDRYDDVNQWTVDQGTVYKTP
jgi:peptide/nickel transport system substrate-binding protein